MSSLFDDPMVQSGLAPFIAALVVAVLLQSLRGAWLALPAALLTVLTLTTGIGFTPLSASRKVLLLALAAPLLGLLLDGLKPRLQALPALLGVVAAAGGLWVFQSVLAQKSGAEAWLLAGGVALAVGLLVAAFAVLRDDGPAVGAATLGLGVAVGVSAVLSASIGNLMNGIALAAGAGALLLLQFVRGTAVPAGWTGALAAAVPLALFGASIWVLAEARPYTVALLLVVPLVIAVVRRIDRAGRPRLVILTFAALAAALPAIASAWLATGATVAG